MTQNEIAILMRVIAAIIIFVIFLKLIFDNRKLKEKIKKKDEFLNVFTAKVPELQNELDITREFVETRYSETYEQFCVMVFALASLCPSGTYKANNKIFLVFDLPTGQVGIELINYKGDLIQGFPAYKKEVNPESFYLFNQRIKQMIPKKAITLRKKRVTKSKDKGSTLL